MRIETSQAVQVELFFTRAGQGEASMTGLAGPGVSGNQAQLAAGSSDLTWDFVADLDGTGFTDDVTLTIARPGGVAISGGTLALGMGNDAPEVLALQPVTDASGEAAGNVEVVLGVSDSSADPVTIHVEWRRASDAPDDWKPATVGGVPPQVGTSAAGVSFPFFWKTDADGLGSVDADFFLRVTADDLTLDRGTPVGIGEAVSASFRVDNNAQPIGSFEDGLLAASTDDTRAIPILYTLRDEESDPTRVVFQWRRQGATSFPALPSTAEELEAVLTDPERRRELHICTEAPPVFEGRVQPPPAGFDPATHVMLPELGGTAAGLLADGVEGLRLEILRASKVPRPVAGTWTTKLVKPVAALPVGNGPTALVLDGNGSWRLREIDLATGSVLQEATGAGTPTAMSLEPDEGAVVVASVLDPDKWQVQRVDLESWTPQPLASVADGTTERGRVQGILSIGSGASVLTVGSSLVRVDYAMDGGISAEPPRASLLLGGFSTPWGLARDPLQVNRIYLAENTHDSGDGRIGRVVTVELDSYIVEEVFVAPGTPPGEGLERPTSIALERNGARLLAVTDGGGDELSELRGVDIGGLEPGVVFELGTFEESAGGLAVGPDALRLLALPTSHDLAVGGGVEQVRSVAGYDPTRLTVSVVPPFAPAPPPNAIWRTAQARDRATSSPNGAAHVFVWDSSDVPQGNVHLGMTPIDSEVGIGDEGLTAKNVRSFRAAYSLGLRIPRPPGRWVVAKDLNGDGRQDLAIGRSKEVHLFYQRTLGSFPEVPDVILETRIGFNPHRIMATDLNHDSRPDIVFRNSGGFAVWHQPTEGYANGAEPDCMFTAPTWGGLFFVAADLDRDRLTDLATYVDSLANVGTLEIYFQCRNSACACPFSERPDCEFPSPGIRRPFFLEKGDINGDGGIDLIVGNTGIPGSDGIGFWTVFFQKDTAGCPFTDDDKLSRTVLRASTADVADLNRDGRLDIVSANMPISWLTNAAPGGPSTLALFYQDPAQAGYFPELPHLVLEDASTIDGSIFPVLEDVNADGLIDLITGNFNSANITVFLQTGALGFEAVPNIVLTGPDLVDPWGVDAADLNGDGRLDLVVEDQGNGKVTVFEQGTPGRFSGTPELVLGTPDATDRPSSVVAADLDGDGLMDLSSANGGDTNALAVFFQRAPGQFSADPESLRDPAIAEGPSSVSAADLDGDGDLELLSANAMEGNLAIFDQISRGVFDSSIGLGGSGATDGARSVIAADMNGDGKLDVVSANRERDSITVFCNPGGGWLHDEPAPSATLIGSLDGPVWVVAADVDADGDLDLACANELSSDLAIFLNSGDGCNSASWSPPQLLGDAATTQSPQVILANDMDGDGRMDLVSANSGSNRVALFFQGRTGFDPLPTSELGSPPTLLSLAAADLDADGDQDLASASGPPGNGDVVGLYMQTAPRHFAQPVTLGGPGVTEGPAHVLAADLNSDGEVDLVAALHRPEATGTGRFFDLIKVFFNGK